jgi:pimeloyl-ACP methyl ester carboxylesterase
MALSMRRLRIDGIDLNVVDEGEGPAVLLVHGFPDDHTVWRKQIPMLVAAGYRVIAPDTRGCGESEIPARLGGYKIDRLVADLAGVLDALGIDKVRLVAHDWGAVQGWNFAMRHPERVERYVALSVGHPNAYARGGFMQKLRGYYIVLFQLRGLAEFLLTRFDYALWRTIFGFPEEFEACKVRLTRPGRLTAGINYYRANLGLILPREFPPVTVPVVGIWSDGDRFLVEGQMTNSARYCTAGFRYQRVDGANHWLQLDAPEKVNPLLLASLA